MTAFDDLEDKLFTFQTMYTSILDEHAPIKCMHTRGNQVP